MPPRDALREAIRERVCAAPGERAEAAACARSIAEAGAGTVGAIVFFGSRKSRASPQATSAYDFFVVPDAYRPFYEALRARGAVSRPVGLLRVLNAVMPPNQVSLPVRELGLRAKCAVIAADAFRRETSAERSDHFLLGRLCQPTEIVHARDAAAEEAALAGIVSAHRLTYRWARPWLPEEFDVEAYVRTMLRVSYGGEIRPEPSGRADALWAAQQAYHRAVYPHLLDELVTAGELRAAGPGRYALARPAGAGERLRLAAYFRLSLVRATLRWAKYVATFEDWLDFIVGKARRHGAGPIELTERERRWPLVFLWPRVIRYLREKDRR